MRYRKKPIVVEAFQMTEERRWDHSEWPEWLHMAWNTEGEGSLFIDPDQKPLVMLTIGTLEGGVYRVSWGDWIIRGVHGELYPCKPDIFEATYEPIEEGRPRAVSAARVGRGKKFWKVYRYACDRCGAFADFFLEEGLEGGPLGEPIPAPAELRKAYEKSPVPVDWSDPVRATPDGRVILPVPFIGAGCPFCQDDPPWDMRGGVLTHVGFGDDREVEVTDYDGCRFEYPARPYEYRACGKPIVVKERFTRRPR